MPVTDRRSVARLSAFFDRYKPTVTKTFINAVADLDGRLELDDMRLQSIGKVAGAGEYVYFDVPGMCLLADSRGELSVFASLMWDLSRYHHHFAHLFVSHYPTAAWRLSQVHGALADLAAELVASGKHGATLLRITLESTSGEQCIRRAEHLRTLARYARALLPDVATVLSEKRSILPPDVLEQWIARGASLAESGRTEESGAFLRFQSRESRALIGLQYAVLSDVRNVLSIYTTSVASRSVTVRDLESSGFHGDRPFTDGQTIYLPGRIRLFQSQRANESAYSAIAALNAGLLRMGTFAFTLEDTGDLTELRGQFGTLLPDVMETLRRRYRGRDVRLHERVSGEVELHYSDGSVVELLRTPHEAFSFLFPTPDFAAELFSYLEYRRVAHALCERYPGLRDELDRVYRALYARRRGRMKSLVEAAGSSLFREFSALVEGVIEEGLAGDWHYRGTNPRLDARITEAADRIRAALGPAGAGDSARLTFELYRHWFELYPLVPFFAETRALSLFSGLGLGVVDAPRALRASPELFAAQEERARYDYEFDEHAEREVDLTSLSRHEGELDSLREALLHGSISTSTYREFDSNLGSYRSRYCTLRESYLEPADPDFYSDTIREQGLVYRRIRKRFMHLQPEDRTRTRRWLDGDDINLADAVDLATDILRGESGDDKIYERHRHNRRDIVAAILVDASSSTEEPVGEKRVIDVEREAMCLLSGALHMVGDAFGVYSFFSMGRANVFCNVVKELSEPWGLTQQARIASMKPHAGNRDGCAIRHVTAKLLAAPQRTKLLLLLSDGIPADAGYGSKRGRETGEYAIADTRRAIDEARQAGVTPYCITVDRFARNYISRLYGHHYAIIDNVERLPERMGRIYARLTS